MLNRVILIGRTTQDAELVYTKQGVAYTRLTLAVDRRRFNNERQTDFIPFVLWRNQAEFAKNYIKKGTLLCIEGEIHISQYTNQTTNLLQRSFDVVVNDIKILQSRANATSSYDNLQRNQSVNSFQANLSSKYQAANSQETFNPLLSSNINDIFDPSDLTDGSKQPEAPQNNSLHELDEMVFSDDASGLTFQFDDDN